MNSIYMRIYLLDNKREVFSNFKSMLLVEKYVECAIKRLGINGGGEYTSNEFA